MASDFRFSVDSLHPDGAFWAPKPGGDYDKVLDALADFEAGLFDDLVLLGKLRDPDATPILSDLEREYGLLPNEALSEEERRAQLRSIVYARRGTGSIDDLQRRLDAAGFDLTVHSNSPAVDPNVIISGDAPMQAGEPLAQAGEPSAQAGEFSGELVVNSAIDDSAFSLPDIGPWPIFRETFVSSNSIAVRGGQLFGDNSIGFFDAPVANWPMLASTHDPGNSRTLDVSGNTNHAIFSPTAPTKTVGRRGYALNGTSNYFSVASAISIIPNGDISNVTLFVAFVRGPGGGSMWWFQRGQGGARTNMSLYAPNATSVAYSGGTGGADISYTTGNIAGQFHTLGYTYEKGSQVLYYDGQSVGTLADSAAYNIANPALRLGGLVTGGGFMDGEMLITLVYDQTLSATLIKDLHNNAVSSYNAS
jgi:hypothetical protein